MSSLFTLPDPRLPFLANLLQGCCLHWLSPLTASYSLTHCLRIISPNPLDSLIQWAFLCIYSNPWISNLPYSWISSYLLGHPLVSLFSLHPSNLSPFKKKKKTTSEHFICYLDNQWLSLDKWSNQTLGFSGRLGIFPDWRGTWSVPPPFSASLSDRIYLENRNQVLLEQAGPCLPTWGRRVKVVLPRTRVQRGLPKRLLPFPGISFNLGSGMIASEEWFIVEAVRTLLMVPSCIPPDFMTTAWVHPVSEVP